MIDAEVGNIEVSADANAGANRRITRQFLPDEFLDFAGADAGANSAAAAAAVVVTFKIDVALVTCIITTDVNSSHTWNPSS